MRTSFSGGGLLWLCFCMSGLPCGGATPTDEVSQAPLFPDYLNIISKSEQYANCCGPVALFISLHSMGVEIPTDRQREIIYNYGTSGSTFADLSALASEFGVHAIAIQCTLKSLINIDRPCILYTGDNHFVSVVGYNEGGLTIVDFPRRPVAWVLDDSNSAVFYRALVF